MTIKTDIGFTTRDRIFVRGRDLADEILGKMDFIDMILEQDDSAECAGIADPARAGMKGEEK